MRRQSLLLFGIMLAALTITLGSSRAQVVTDGALVPAPEPEGPVTLASLGTAFTYQGRLTGGGALVNGNCDFQFSLFNAAAGGTQIGSAQTKSAVNVSSGFFTIPDLNFGAGAFDGQARWLEIAVRCPAGSGSFTTLNPRQTLTPVPYALHAANAWALGGNSGTNPATQFIGTTDNQPLELRVNNARVLRLEPNATSPNIIAGYSGNSVTSGVVGATIAGGGSLDTGCSGPCVNRVTDDYGTIGGGYFNRAGNDAGTTSDRPYATVGGGNQNVASGQYATVSGGQDNTAQGGRATVGGGSDNIANGDYATVGGGRENAASSNSATVGGGYKNNASGSYATVGGGVGNTASNNYATVSGGLENSAGGFYAALGGGYNNAITAGGDYATIGGGSFNVVNNSYATVVGGRENTASGQYATVSGGFSNTAAGDYSFAAGRRAQGNHHGVFLFADSNNFNFPSTAANQFRVRATGGVQFVTGIDGSGNPVAGVQVAAGGGSWSSLSDRNAKTDFAPVNPRMILARLATLPIQTWRYKTQVGVRHIGPTAQDFYAAFGVGEDDTHIAAIDADGVALAAIQGLYQLAQEQAAEITALRAQIAALEARLAALEQRSAPVAP
ncbi:tail fiber domain-containing protein [Chloroflexus sp.]|uniref:tail fiber domain-containing protein n=1 Tax=Chloroflexus sp. TaxID=1904827 RepID=UPI002ACD94CD|nr:tail fiber domain-containing protein [Chloroflexus sp.]